MKGVVLRSRVQALRPVAADILEISLVPADGGEFPAYSAGSHVVLLLPLGERVQRNPYSLLGDPAEHGVWRIAVRRERPSRGGSQWLHERLVPGRVLELSWPFNLFALDRTARHHLLVAGGIGITPILCQARELARAGASFEVHYGFRGAEQAAFADELLQAGTPGRVRLHDSAAGGRIDFAALLVRRPLGSHLYVCGPQSMVAAALQAGAALGWPASHLHSEQFIAPAGGEPFEVELRASGRRFMVPADMSLLETIEQQGVDAPSLCRGGACGQCELEVLEADGRLLHRDLVLSEAERAGGRKIIACVSRLEGRCLALNL